MFVYNKTNSVNNLIKEDNESYKSYLQMDKVMKKLFSMKNPKPIIDFINAIYGDQISYDAKITYSDKEIINTVEKSSKLISFYADMYVTVVEGNNVYEYAIEFQTVFDNEIAVRIFRYSFERAVKLADYSRAKECIKLKMPEPYVILLEEEKDVGDFIKLEMEFSRGVKFTYDIQVLRYWTYDIERLYKENMYLLYPLQIFKLRKKMNKISKSNKPENIKKKMMLEVYDELKIVLEKTLIAIDSAYEDGKIEISDYDVMNTVIENLNCYFADMYGKYGEIEEAIREMVKSFYDPKIEERGMEKEREKSRLKDVERVLKLLEKKFKDVDAAIKEKVTKSHSDKLNLIIENILDIESLEEVKKYLS